MTVNIKINQLVKLINDRLKLFLTISFGVFLFMLFFQPFSLTRFDFNDRLLFFAGFGGIVFIILTLVRVALPWMIHKQHDSENAVIPSYLSGFLILAMNTVAFAFYLRFVGFVEISFYIIFKMVFICLVPPVCLRLYDEITELRKLNEIHIIEKKVIQKQIEKYEEDLLNKTLTFNSENSAESLTISVSELVLIKSADNYVEIVYKEGDLFKKRLIRNTLKNIEQQLKPFSNFIRCHRISIVNIHYVEKLNKNYNNHWLTIHGYPDEIPVSRQYLLKLKELL